MRFWLRNDAARARARAWAIPAGGVCGGGCEVSGYETGCEVSGYETGREVSGYETGREVSGYETGPLAHARTRASHAGGGSAATAMMVRAHWTAAVIQRRAVSRSTSSGSSESYRTVLA